MKILFLHGWHSVPGGVKPTHLASHVHEVINPALDDDDWDRAVRTAQVEYDHHRPNVIVGSSRGGAIAMNLESDSTPLVLLCPAWKRWGKAGTSRKRCWGRNGHLWNDTSIPIDSVLTSHDPNGVCDAMRRKSSGR